MPKSKKPTKQPPLRHKRIITITLIILTIIVSLPWFFPYHYYRYVKCGREPVKVISRDFSNETVNYIVPTDSSYKDYKFFINGYYCSEDDAKRDGLKNLYNEDGQLNSESTLRK